jgi:hypothetical protein
MCTICILTVPFCSSAIEFFYNVFMNNIVLLYHVDKIQWMRIFLKSGSLCDDNIKIDNRGISFYRMGRLNCFRI